MNLLNYEARYASATIKYPRQHNVLKRGNGLCVQAIFDEGEKYVYQWYD